jgi:hypothetical protein
MKFVYSTQAANLAVLRTRFKAASGIEAAKMARWIHANLTVAQIKNVFNLTDAQVTTLRAKFVVLRDHLAAVEGAKSE